MGNFVIQIWGFFSGRFWNSPLFSLAQIDLEHAVDFEINCKVVGKCKQITSSRGVAAVTCQKWKSDTSKGTGVVCVCVSITSFMQQQPLQHNSSSSSSSSSEKNIAGNAKSLPVQRGQTEPSVYPLHFSFFNISFHISAISLKLIVSTTRDPSSFNRFKYIWNDRFSVGKLETFTNFYKIKSCYNSTAINWEFKLRNQSI